MRNNSENSKIEKFLEFVADTQAFSNGKDKLSALINQYDDSSDGELSEDELIFAAAAKRPAIPAYKLIDNDDK